ncbi:MAG: 4Fe-4S cluster-binding domain-containing protein, partial [Alphaproteobacteria bacterium]|nr:4Fe-4S cluster-binding domain-containing protein [Alphaproteobacteria bacterium]
MNAPLATTLRTIRHLANAGLVDADPALDRVAARYAIAIPAALADDIAATGRDGPLARQYLPSTVELATAPHENADPTGDAPFMPVKGIVHRYRDRALLMPTQVCAVYCRFCFRRESVGPAAGALTDAELAAAIAYIDGRPEIWEVILSGGDPLVLSPRRLVQIVNALDRIDHVQVVRFHTRVPVASPDRIDDSLIAAIMATSKPVYVVIHCNHAAELSQRARTAFSRLRHAGAILLSHSVLLAGVNDSEAALEDLFRALVANGVRPYYL